MSYFLKTEWKYLILFFCIAFLSQLILAISVSPLSYFEGYDSCVFKQMGLAILQDKELYKDLFDHKGPILYLINALGTSMNIGRWGLFLLITFNLTSVLYLWYMTAKNFVNGWKSLLPVFLTLVAYLSVMEEANQTEDWSLIPISYAVYLCSRHISHLDDHISKMEYFALGLSAGIITFIRMNNMALTCCVVIYLIAEYCIEKKYRLLSSMLLIMFCGFSLVFIISYAWFFFLYGHDGIYNLTYGTFLYNMFEYSSWSSYYDFFVSSYTNHLYFFAAFITCFYAYLYEKKNLRYWLFFTFSFIFCFFTMGRAAFPHYLITVVPLFAMSSAYAFRVNVKAYVWLSMIFLLVNESFYRKQIPYTLGQTKRSYQEFYMQTDFIIKNMSEHERKDIWNYNAWFDALGILQRHKLTQVNRVMLSFQIGSTSLKRSEAGELQRKKPQWLLLNPEHPYIFEGDSLFIAQEYSLYKETSMHVESKSSDISVRVDFYKRR